MEGKPGNQASSLATFNLGEEFSFRTVAPGPIHIYVDDGLYPLAEILILQACHVILPIGLFPAKTSVVHP